MYIKERPGTYKALGTGASLHAPYSLLLISNKFWMGKVGSRRGRLKGPQMALAYRLDAISQGTTPSHFPT
jgi:hypothetical protein